MSGENSNGIGVNRDTNIFPLDDSYIYPIDQLKEFVERLIKPQVLSPFDLQGFARLLLALKRLPVTTPGVDVVLTVANRINEELSFYDLSINDSEFELGYGGSVYDPAVGHDSYSNKIFSVSISGFNEGYSDDILNWLDSAQELLNIGAEVSIEDNSVDDEIEWDDQAREKYWDEKLDEI